MKTAPATDLITLHAPRDFRGEAATALLAEAEASLIPNLHVLELDFSDTVLMDGSGLGVLLELHRYTTGRTPHVSLRILDPLPEIRHLLELGRLHHLFAIIGSNHPFGDDFS